MGLESISMSSLSYVPQSMLHKQVDEQELIAANPETHGATFVPIVLGSDKKTVSVRTGNTEYYPLYISLGNVHNHVR